MKARITKALKPKVASLGFSAEDLEDAIVTISSSLNETSTDEEVDAACDAVIPYLKAAQKMANRVINKKKPEPTPVPEPKQDKEGEDEMPSWFKTYKEQTEAKIAELERQRDQSSRQQRLEALLKDSGKFGERVKRNFAKMTFANEDEFNTFMSDTENDLEDYKKEVSEGGHVAPVGGFGGKKSPKERTEAEKKALFDQI